MHKILAKLNSITQDKSKPLNESVSEASYSAKAAAAGKDIGKPGKAFAKIAKDAGERYGSKERGEKVAGAVLKKLRAKEDVAQEGNAFTGALAKARADGVQKGEKIKVGGKVYPVKEDELSEREYYDREDFDKHAKPGDTFKPSKTRQLTKTAKGFRHEKIASDEPENDDDRDAPVDRGGKPKKKGRPAGTKKRIGAKGPTGKSKLLKKDAIKEAGPDGMVDQGEYGREGDMAKEQLSTIEAAAEELASILSDDQDLPEWVQSKITLAKEYVDTARDYMLSQAEEGKEQMVPERKLTKGEESQREKLVKGMKKAKGDFEKRYGDRGEEVMYATATKMAKKKGKKEESVEETTTAGSVATAPTGGKKSAGGMQFGKGVYEAKLAESFDKKLAEVLNEGMSINMSVGEDGEKSITVNATDEDAIQLAEILKMAGLGVGHEHSSSCGCQEQVEEELANEPDATYAGTDTLVNKISGGLNGQKLQVNPNNMGDNPLAMRKLGKEQAAQINLGEEIETRLVNLYKQYKG